MSRYDHIFRMLLLGDHNTGKTAVLQALRRQNLGNFRGRRHSIAVQPVFTMDVEIKRGNWNLLVKAMDTGGQEKYRSLTASYYRGAHGCLILFDVTKESSFENLSYWLHDLKEYTSNPEISTIIVGTKCHVSEDKREVTYERAQKYAESEGIPYVEVSAEEGTNVTEVFEKLADLIIDNMPKSQASVDITKSVKLEHQPPKKHQWCSC